MLKTKITIDLTNVSRDDIKELEEYLEVNCWEWRKTNEKY